jgi:hypothetical protein
MVEFQVMPRWQAQLPPETIIGKDPAKRLQLIHFPEEEIKAPLVVSHIH